MSFFTAKRIGGCSEKTLRYYRDTIVSMISVIGKQPRQIKVEDFHAYLTNYNRSDDPLKRQSHYVLILAKLCDFHKIRHLSKGIKSGNVWLLAI